MLIIYLLANSSRLSKLNVPEGKNKRPNLRYLRRAMTMLKEQWVTVFAPSRETRHGVRGTDIVLGRYSPA